VDRVGPSTTRSVEWRTVERVRVRPGVGAGGSRCSPGQGIPPGGDVGDGDQFFRGRGPSPGSGQAASRAGGGEKTNSEVSGGNPAVGAPHRGGAPGTRACGVGFDALAAPHPSRAQGGTTKKKKTRPLTTRAAWTRERAGGWPQHQGPPGLCRARPTATRPMLGRSRPVGKMAGAGRACNSRTRAARGRGVVRAPAPRPSGGYGPR